MPSYIVNENGRKSIYQFLAECPDDQHEVLIQPKGYFDNRKKKRGLAHVWMKFIADYVGEPIEATKLRIKKALPFAFEPHAVRADAVQSYLLHGLKKIDGYEPSPEAIVYISACLERAVKAMRSSEDYTPQEYTEFIDAVAVEAHKHGLNLPQDNNIDWSN